MSEARLVVLALILRCDACGTAVEAEIGRDDESVEHAIGLIRVGAKCVCATTEVTEMSVILGATPEESE